MKLILGACFAAAATMAMPITASAQEDGKTIEMGTMSWEDLTPITLIEKRMLEDRGFTVNVTEFAEWGIAYAALANGDVDIMVSQVDYVAQDYWERNKDDLEKVSPVSHGLFQGIAVPSYVDIDSVDQLAENADQFNNRIVGIEPGAGLMRETADAVDEYDLPLTLTEGSTPAMTAELQSAIDREAPIAVTLWTPSWMTQRFDVKFLEDPNGVFSPPQTYYWIARAGWSAENPEAREILASTYVPIDDITELNGAVNEGQSMEEAVNDWVDNNTDLMERWSNLGDKYE